jgi:DNA invertase Pin-like site-specific DNA recombinase
LEEQRSLGTIISREIVAERRRAKRGVVSREEYLASVSKPDRDAKVIEMYKEGMTQQQIAEVFGLSKVMVGKIINKNK